MYTTSAYVSSQEYTYDLRGNVICFTNDIGGRAYSQTYRYGKLTDENDNIINDSLRNGKEGLVTRYGALGTYTYYTYDGFNRRQLATVDLDTDIVIDYDYKISDRTEGTYYTTQISSENINGVRYNYTYDNMGNITAITKAGANYRAYVYDVLGQLITEKQFDNKQQTQYTYNHLGNITKKVVTTYTDSALTVVSSTVTYQYRYGNDNAQGWNYLLTSYDINGDGIVDEGEKISYDEIGNPTTYMGAATSWNGRQLTAYSKGGVNATFTYDADGLRGSKTVNGVKTIYQYVGDKLYYEKRGDNQEFYYFYDGFGNLSTIYYTFGDSRAIYYVTTNMQGDVNAIYNSSGALVARYEYDAWGNTLSVTDANGNPITAWYNIANANPIRYRGYYYDKDLDLYYLQSRYYDSNTGRFLNADGFVTTGQGVLSYNMFAYCMNNPVNMYDGLGTFPLETAFKFLFNWVFGNGEKKEYNDKSRISKKLKDSSKMQGKVDEAIDNYKQGQSTTVGVGEFTAAEDGYELYLSTQHFEYSIVVEEETRSNGILFWKHEESRYVATVTVSDTYNFDKRRGWNSFGNIMNDIAYEYDQYIGGNDFEWCATYKYSTKWKDND